MLEQFIELDHGRMGLVIALIAIIGSMLTVLLAIISYQWRKAHEADLDAQLKIQMLEMGMKAEEVALVLEAGRRGRKRDVKGIVADWRRKLDQRAPAC
ncbi:hypothetical protein K2X85_03025 [bacterium]|jgi:hypothetical protein|nr:hypothetical protein [bacterium]